MELFTFVELGMDTPTQGVIFEISATTKMVLTRRPYSCQQLGQLPLTRIGLQSAEQGSCDVATFERACHTR